MSGFPRDRSHGIHTDTTISPCRLLTPAALRGCRRGPGGGCRAWSPAARRRCCGCWTRGWSGAWRCIPPTSRCRGTGRTTAPTGPVTVTRNTLPELPVLRELSHRLQEDFGRCLQHRGSGCDCLAQCSSTGALAVTGCGEKDPVPYVSPGAVLALAPPLGAHWASLPSSAVVTHPHGTNGCKMAPELPTCCFFSLILFFIVIFHLRKLFGPGSAAGCRCRSPLVRCYPWARRVPPRWCGEQQ